jgi:hypothetical protein
MKSLDTRDWQRALRKKAEMEDPDAPRVKTVADAATAFEQHILSLEASTQRKYKTSSINSGTTARVPACAM